MATARPPVFPPDRLDLAGVNTGPDLDPEWAHRLDDRGRTHACASLLLAQGVAPRVVMETLGHSQISLALNTYSHVLPTLQREAADRMEDVLSNR